jgi:hypothetical protein
MFNPIKVKTRELLLTKLPQKSIGAEIGVFKGEFSKIILDVVNPALLYLIDPWKGEIISGDKNGKNITSIKGDWYYDNYILPKFSSENRITILRNKSTILETFDNYFLDWIYIDANHDFESVNYDLHLSFAKVKKNGCIMGHDYDPINYPGVVRAVTEFCWEKKLKIDYITEEDGCPSFLIKL